MENRPVPTLSIGNIAMGGRGKTPLVARVTRALLAAGERPAILSRGYARRRAEDGVVVVSDGAHVLADLDRAGDEPLMLARALPGARVLVCDQRAIAARLAERVFDASVLILDDGFQHRAVARDVDIVAIAPADLDDRRLPFGRLRSSPSSLRRAHAIVVDGPDVPAGLRQFDNASIFTMTRRLGAPVPLESHRHAPDAGSRVIAVAGIANPDRFSSMLMANGWDVARVIAYRDHHQFTPRDVDHIAKAVADAGAEGVLTTEKDAVRLLPLRPLPVAIAAVPLEIQLDGVPGKNGAAEFNIWLIDRVRKARA